MPSTASLVWNLMFSAIGAGYFLYGKRQQAGAPMLCGFGLMVFPYFVSSTWVLVAVGVVLMAIPFLARD